MKSKTPVPVEYEDLKVIEQGPVKNLDRKHQLIADAIALAMTIIASSIYALAVAWFLEPAKLVSLGLTAVGQILNRLIPVIPVGVFVLIFNIPLCILGFKYVSKRFIIFTMASVLTQSLLLMGWIPVPEFLNELTTGATLGSAFNSNTLFLSILGGLLGGFAIGLALRYGGSTGGVDVIAQVLKLRKNISVSAFSAVINIILAVIAGGIMEGDWAITFCTFIYIILSYLVVDKVHTGYNYVRIDVITKKKDEICEGLIRGIGRGCTVLEVRGGYTREPKYDLFMVVSRYELDRAKIIIDSIDEDAWVTVTPVKQIIGAFFRHTIS